LSGLRCDIANAITPRAALAADLRQIDAGDPLPPKVSGQCLK
jgi:hypothetical protein